MFLGVDAVVGSSRFFCKAAVLQANAIDARELNL
jgi:hypothetical protein